MPNIEVILRPFMQVKIKGTQQIDITKEINYRKREKFLELYSSTHFVQLEPLVPRFSNCTRKKLSRHTNFAEEIEHH